MRLRPAPLSCVAVAAALVLALPACGHFSVRPAHESFERGDYAPAKLRIEGDIPIAQVQGSPEELGYELGSLVGKAARDLLGSWKLADFFRSLAESSAAPIEELAGTVPDAYQRELAALSTIADIESGDLLRANAVIDACSCTAFAASGTATGGAPLLVGRNMDFAPANVLGAKTLVTVYRAEGKHAFVSIGWPGFAAVASGMNDEGLVACILINSGAAPRASGIPLGFLVRRILEECSTVDEARVLFHQSPPASGHFVFLADPRTAACVSRDAPDRLMEEGLLACTNGKVDSAALVQTDRRARCVSDLLERTKGSIDVETARSILAATYLRMENTHAMVFVPEKRVLWLARGTTFAPAALGSWSRFELASAFAGAADPLVTAAEPVARCFEHWKDKAYEGAAVDRRLKASAVSGASR